MNLRTIIPAAAALALCFSACSNDDSNSDPNPIVDNGAEAGLKLSISAPVQTRTADPNATTEESRFVTADVFIYADNSLVKHVRLAKSQFVSDDVNKIYTTEDPILTTEGPKDIYVGLNLPVALGKAIAGNGSKAGLALVSRADLYQLDNESATAGFVMFSDKEVSENLIATADLLPGQFNSVSIDVERIVAKVTVQTGASLNTDVIGGTIHDLKWGIRNSNLLFYPFQQKDGGKVIDPNHYGGSYAAADFKHTEYTPTSDYVDVDAHNTDVLDRNAMYTAENTTEKMYQWETTYASVEAVYIPAKLTRAKGQEYETYDNPNKDPNQQATFWVVKLTDDGSAWYFLDKDEAIAFATNKGEVSEPYVDGKCYYNLFLNPTNSFQTIRNDFYQCRITSILGLGNPNPWDGGDKEIPVTKDANIIVEINIVPWNILDYDDYELY